MRCCHDIDIIASGTAGNDALLDMEPAIDEFIGQTEGNVPVPDEFLGPFFCFPENITGILIKFIDFIRIARMEWKGNHRLDRRKIYFDKPIIICHISRI